MGLRTRLDGRSKENSAIQLKNSEGVTLAEITLLGSSSATLEFSTQEGIYLEKLNGWNSQLTEEGK